MLLIGQSEVGAKSCGRETTYGARARYEGNDDIISCRHLANHIRRAIEIQYLNYYVDLISVANVVR